MNKEQFLTLLRIGLKDMPVKEMNELLEDYETHYAFGLQEGRTEEEISVELGDPLELAVEAMAEFERNHVPARPTSTHITRTTFTVVGLFILNFVFAVIPVAITIWAVWLSLILAGSSLVLSPGLIAVEYLINGYFSMGKLFACIAFSGIGIFMLYGVSQLGKKLKTGTIAYYNWNVRVIKGGQLHE